MASFSLADPEIQFVVAFVFINFIAFLILLFFNSPGPYNFGIFKNQVADVSKEFEVDITPAGPTFAIWGLIYTWQLAWLIFNIIIVFLTTNQASNSGLVFISPLILNISFEILIFCNFILNITWIFLFNNKLLTGGFIVIFGMTATLYGALAISHINIYNARFILSSSYIWAYRILVNNGIALYATWLTIATVLSFAIAFTYAWTDNVDRYKSVSSLIGLSFLITIVFVYFLFDVWLFEPYLRYTFTVYPVIAIAIAGILAKNWAKRSPSAIFAAVIATLCVPAMIIIKIVLLFYYGSLDGYN